MQRAVLLAVLVLAACQTQDSPVEPPQELAPLPDLAIMDGTREGGNPGFFWAQPIALPPWDVYQGSDLSLLPFLAVEVCEWNGTECVGGLLRRYTSKGDEVKGIGSHESDHLQVLDPDLHPRYGVWWDAAEDNVEVDKLYRISVKAGPVELGYADVDVANGIEVWGVDPNEFLGINSGWVVPIEFVVSHGAVPVALRWETLAPIPAPVHASTAAAVGTRIYVMGGQRNFFDQRNDNQAFDAVTGGWATRAALPTANAWSSAVTVDGRIHLIGGVGEPQGHRVYDPVGDSWEQAAPPIEPRWAAVAEVVNGRIYLIGGRPPTNVQTRTVQIYNPGTDSWSLGNPLPTGRQNMVSTEIAGRIYVAGGEASSFVTLRTLEAYDPVANSWETLAPMPTPLEGLGGGAIDGEFCVFGGRLVNPNPTGDALPETYCYDPASDSWSRGPDMITPRVNLATVELDGAVYAVSGRLGDISVQAFERLIR